LAGLRQQPGQIVSLNQLLIKRRGLKFNSVDLKY